MPGFVFFVMWPLVSLVAFTVQVWFTSPEAEKNREETLKRYRDAQATRHSKGGKKASAKTPEKKSPETKGDAEAELMGP